MSHKPLPPIDPWTAPYWAAAREHRLLIQQCSVCGQHIFYPRRNCPFCFADEVAWVEASGRGKIVSFSIVQNNAPSAFVADMPFVISIVRLDEGVQMMTNIVECDLDALHCEMPVTVTFEKLTETVTLPKFKPMTAH